MIEIRQAMSTDVEKIAQFNISLCKETEGRELDPVTVMNGVERFVCDPKRGRYFVAEIDGKVVGQAAHTFEWSDWRNGEIWWMQSVYVHPDFRDKGVFRTLFTHMKELSEANVDCCGIRLYMERENEIARESYRRLGFSETGYVVFERLLSRKDST
jgi:GNAT superfamily N-acetyltransferase